MSERLKQIEHTEKILEEVREYKKEMRKLELLTDGFSCDPNKRRKCDSLYIEKYNELALKAHEVIELINSSDRDDELLKQIKEKLLSNKD